MNRLGELQEERSLNQEDISAYLGVDQSTYSRYINGKIEMPIDILCKLANYYETSVDYLLCLTDQRQPYPKSIVTQEDE